MSPAVEIAIDCADWVQSIPDLEALSSEVAAAALEIACKNSVDDWEISFLYCDDVRIQELNRHWRGQDKPTNVLAFPAHPQGREPLRLLGDVVMAFQTSRDEALRDGKSLRQHASHLIVHGVLHLLGYDHETDDGATEMEKLERDCLARLGLPDPYGATFGATA